MERASPCQNKISEFTTGRVSRGSEGGNRVINVQPQPVSANLDQRKMDLLQIEILDREILSLEKEKSHLKNKLEKLQRRKPGVIMSETDYVRRRDEINRLLKRDEKEIREIRQERDQARKDKKNVESAYKDVQEKYERVLKSLQSLKDKEDLLIERDNENLVKVQQLDKELEEYKETARKQVESEYQNWLSKLAEAEATNVRLKALIRKSEMKVEKMEHELGRRNKENDQLHNLCDDLINNSSRKSSVQEDYINNGTS